MKVFLDTEFTGLHQATTLISIGMVAENGRTFYGEFNDYDETQVDEWIQENVIRNLYLRSEIVLPVEGWVESGEIVIKELHPSQESKELGKSSEIVIKKLHPSQEIVGLVTEGAAVSAIDNRDGMAMHIKDWLESFGETIEIWSDCLAYDWVLFNELFGGALDIPECVYYIPFDICTLLKMRRIDPDIDREKFAGMGYAIVGGEGSKHNALWDARIIKACYEILK